MQRAGQRRLVVVMIADIVGYSRMMHEDETGTHTRVVSILRETVLPAISEHRGTIVKTRGDGFLASFDSPVEAVRCAIVIQNHMVSYNLELPRAQWVQYRIGINLGDVIIEDDDIYGDGVNIAARLEQLAEPGSIYVSGAIYEQVKNRLVCAYQSLGDRRVKNITDPIAIYRVLPDPESLRKGLRGRTLALVAFSLVLGAAGGAYLVWQHVQDRANAHTPLVAENSVRTPAPSAPVAEPAPVIPAAPPRPEPAPAASMNGQGLPTPTGSAPSSTASLPPAAPPSGEAQPPATASVGTPNPAPPPAPLASKQRQPEQVAIANVPPLSNATKHPAPNALPAPSIAEPEMVLIHGGKFRMGSREDPSEEPEHWVNVTSFSLGKYPVTVGEWQICAAAGHCPDIAHGVARQPMTNVSWNDAVIYLAWLSRATGKAYRLPSEAEWEYAARGGTRTRYWWGNAIGVDHAACKGCGVPNHGLTQPLLVGQFAPNPFGLFDMGGLVAEWVVDCWHPDYIGAPKTALPWNCADARGDRVLRGGSWLSEPALLRVSDREHYEPDVRYPGNGFRVARSD